MRLFIFVMAGLAFCLPSLPADARTVRRDVLKLAPTGQWQMDYDDERCRLTRNFGVGPRMITLVMEQFEPSDSFTMIFVGRSIKPRQRDPWVTGEFRFGPNEPLAQFRAFLGKVGIENAAFVHTEQRLVQLSAEEKAAGKLAAEKGEHFRSAPISESKKKAATYLEITNFLDYDVILDTGPMDRPLLVLDHCAWDLVASWGLNVAQQKALSREAVPDPKIKWVTAEDYPEKMLDRGDQANVRVRVMVDAQGKPTECVIQKATNPPGFGELVCKNVMKKGRFTPALDAEGNPVSSFISRAISFRIYQ